MFGFLKRKKTASFFDGLSEDEMREVMLAMMSTWEQRSKMNKSDGNIIRDAAIANALRRIKQRREANDIPKQCYECDDNGNNG